MGPDGGTVLGACATLANIYESHQREVDELGTALRNAMARLAQ